jgi:hypothetical protein
MSQNQVSRQRGYHTWDMIIHRIDTRIYLVVESSKSIIPSRTRRDRHSTDVMTGSDESDWTVIYRLRSIAGSKRFNRSSPAGEMGLRDSILQQHHRNTFKQHHINTFKQYLK